MVGKGEQGWDEWPVLIYMDCYVIVKHFFCII